MAISIKANLCPQNHPCPALQRCPAGALTQQDYQAPQLDAAKCISCKKCIAVCPMGAFAETAIPG